MVDNLGGNYPDGGAFPTKIPSLSDAADIQAALSLYHYGETVKDYANVTSVKYSEANTTNGSVVGYIKGLQEQVDLRANIASPNLTGNVTVTGNVTAPRFISNVATGTAPFSVTSTTVVPNLTAYKVGTAQTIKINSGSTEGTDLYTFDGSFAKTLDILPGANISFSTSANALTIDSQETNSYPTDKSFGANVTVSSDLFIGNVIAQKVVDAGLTYSSVDNSYTINVAAGNYFTNITAKLYAGTWTYVGNTSVNITATSGTLTLPTTQVGDIVVIIVAADGNTVNVTTSGWTQISNSSSSSVFYKQIQNNSTETSVIITNSGTGRETVAIASAYRNSAHSTYGSMRYSAYVYDGNSNASTVIAPSITTVGPNSLVVAAVSIRDADATINSVGSGWSNFVTAKSATLGVSVAMANKVVASPGSSGTASFSDTNYSNNQFYAYTIEFLGYLDQTIKLSNTSFLSSGTYKGSTYKINITGVTGANSTNLIFYDSAIKWKSNTVTAISNTTGYLNNTLKLETFDGVSFRATMDTGY